MRPATKRLVLDSSKLAQLPGKIEGMTLVDGTLYLINDDDFGIEGAHTNMIAIEGLDLQLRHRVATAVPPEVILDHQGARGGR